MFPIAEHLTVPTLLFLAHGLGWLTIMGLRRRPVYALLAALCVLLLIVLTLSETDLILESTLPTEWSIPRIGLELALNLDHVPQLIFIHCLVGVALLLSLLHPTAVPSWSGLMPLLAGYSLVLMVQQGPLVKTFLYPLFLLPLAAWIPATVTRDVPSLRFTFLAPLLAAPCFVLAHWFIFSQLPTDPQSESLIETANILLAVGLFILCLPFPLYLLWRNLGEQEALIPNAVVQLLYQLVVLQSLFAAIESHPPLNFFEPLYVWLGWAAIITVCWSGIAAVGTQSPVRIWFYAAMLNWGMILLVFTLPLVQVRETILTLFLLRCLCLLACLTGLGLLREDRLQNTTDWEGLGKSRPWNMALFLFGALGLVGFPLTSGFGPFWVIWQFIATVDWQVALILALGTTFTALGIIRVLRLLLRPASLTTHLSELPIQKLQAAALLTLLIYISFAPRDLDPFTRALITYFQ